MPITRMLWRMDPLATIPTDLSRLADGLHLHTIHSPLTTVALRIATLQRCYLALESCEGCARESCRIGCPASLFRRMLSATLPGSTLHLVAPPPGLASRPYTRIALAWPSSEAAPFEPRCLAAWDEARLLVHWWRSRSGVAAAALLAVGDGPDPLAFARARGWTALALPRRLGSRVANTAMPHALWPLRAWSGAPFMLCS